MFKWLHTRCDAQMAAVLALHHELMSRQDKTIADLREEIINLRAKISLQETILMPLSSNAGAQYQELVNPPKRQSIKNVQAPVNEWQRYKAQKDKELEQSYKEDETNAGGKQTAA